MKTLAEIAIEARLISKSDAARVGRIADQKGLPVIAVLVRELGVDEVALVAAIRRQTRVPLLDPADARPDPEAIRLVAKDVCKRLRVLPLGQAVDPSASSGPAGGKVLRLAMADPTDAAAVAELEQLTGYELEITALPLSAVEELIEKGYQGFTTAVVRAPRRRFGERVVATTSPHHRALVEKTVEVPLAVPLPSVHDPEQKLDALVRLLVKKGVISEAELVGMLDELDQPDA
ncbi:MAG: hypothetical protein KA297_17180 [Kofleriaceae bacterium]|nr:hypothetical protein [Kofleriaceae bacterium]MBP6839772.1 hypothetical protein [Kofleriaceae bacterium]